MHYKLSFDVSLGSMCWKLSKYFNSIVFLNQLHLSILTQFTDMINVTEWRHYKTRQSLLNGTWSRQHVLIQPDVKSQIGLTSRSIFQVPKRPLINVTYDVSSKTQTMLTFCKKKPCFVSRNRNFLFLFAKHYTSFVKVITCKCKIYILVRLFSIYCP